MRDDDDVFGLGVGCEGMLNILIQPLRAESAYEPFAGVLEELEHAPSADLELANGEGTARILAPLKLLVLGAGQDALPLVAFSVALGWKVTVSDHRPAAVERLLESGAAVVECVPLGALRERFDIACFDAVIVMSHNLDADRTYLGVLLDSPVEFVGLLGPPHRRDRLLRELGDDAEKLSGRLRGPVGKRIGGRGPAAIALEVTAELQAYFSPPDEF